MICTRIEFEGYSHSFGLLTVLEQHGITRPPVACFKIIEVPARAADIPPASSMMRPVLAMLYADYGRPGNARVYWGDGEVMWER